MKPAITKYLSSIGKKGGSTKSPRKAGAARVNGTKGGTPRKTYYLLSGEGDNGSWSGPIVTTGRGISQRATRERCNGDRWCRVFEFCPESATRRACVVDIAGGEIREVPQP